jgi:hypothetical protein
MSLKLIKKWMIIPYQDENPEREKIQRILNNKSINNNDKLKYINNIIVSKNQIHNDVFGRDQKISTQNKESDSVLESPDTRAGPGGNSTMFTMRDEYSTPTTLSDEQKDLEGDTFLENNEHTMATKDGSNNDETLEAKNLPHQYKDLDRTFKNLYDYLPPADQTRSKSDIDRSYLSLSKQKKRTKHRPPTPEKFKNQQESLRGKKRKNFTQNNSTTQSTNAKKFKNDEKTRNSKKKTSSVNENEIPTFLPNNSPDLEFQKRIFTGFDNQGVEQGKKIATNNTLKIFNSDILKAPLKKPKSIKWTKYNNSTPKKKLFR